MNGQALLAADDADSTTGNIGIGQLFWGSLWRANLYGVLLGAGFGAFYGAAYGTLMFPLVGTAFGCFFGVIAGAITGLPLGVLDGLVLCALLRVAERLRRRPGGARFEARRLRLLGAAACAAASLIALLLDWSLHGWPSPNGFATGRARTLSLDLFLVLHNNSSSDVTADAITLTIWVFVPMLMILLASWLTGRAVAGWYARKVSETRPCERELDAEDERSPT